MKEYVYLIYYDRCQDTYSPKFQTHKSIKGAKEAVNDMIVASIKRYGDVWQQTSKGSPLWLWESNDGEYLSIKKMKVNE